MILDDCYTVFINLARRPDRLEHMRVELEKAGILAERFPAIDTGYDIPCPMQYPRHKIQRMLMRTPGAIGCHYSQVSVMQVALTNLKHAFVMEDDLVFCSDFQARLPLIENFLSTHKWDVFWLGGTFHVNPHVWHTGRHPELRGKNLGRDVECTEDPRIVRTYGAFCTYAYIVNVESIARILDLLDKNMHDSIGIDWLFIKIQPELRTYAFVPGCVKQMDNQSNIGTGITRFSGFSQLGPYWWQDKMDAFDPYLFNWAEAKKEIQ